MSYAKRYGKDYRSKRNWNKRAQEGERKQLLDMRRAKYFGFDLNDMLDEFNIGDNKNTILATITTKMTSHSLDDALEYAGRVRKDGTLSEEQETRLKILLKRYSKWR